MNSMVDLSMVMLVYQRVHVQWEFQDPKLEVPTFIFQAYFQA